MNCVTYCYIKIILLQDPLSRLSDQFGQLEDLLKELPITKADGSKGLLATGGLKDATETIPEYNVQGIIDSPLLAGKLIS